MEELNIKSSISQDFLTMKKVKKEDSNSNMEMDIELNYE